MRVIFGVLGLLIVVAIIGMVARQQLGAASRPLPGLAAPGSTTGEAGSAPAPAGTPQQQIQQVQKAVEGAVQAPRAMPDEK